MSTSTNPPYDSSDAPLSGRYFLLLQGPQSHFFRRLADGLVKEGARVDKVNFCGGDRMLWGLGRRALDYTGTLYEWPEWIGHYYREEGVTDICLYGDWRPLHWEAVRLAYARGIRVWVFEEGYLRAGFSTLEENGVNGRSSLPVNPQDIREMAVGLPDPKAITVENDIRDKVYKAIFHHVGNVCLWPKFHHYRTHRPTNIFFELLGILPRYLTRNKRSERSLKALEAFNASDDPYFFYPLQLVSDSQVQLYSPYVRVQEAIADVLASFALHAHHKTRLLIKNHPLDNGLIDYGEFIKGFAEELGIADRVTYVEDGSTADMIAGSRGVVLINSTVGLMALDQNKPVYCMGRSIYNIEGLTQSLPSTPLDMFWRAPKAPNKPLYRSMAISAAPAACSNPVSSFSNAMSARASMRQAASARAPLQTTSTRLSSGVSVVSAASSAKAQGPAIRTAAYSAGRMPATRRRRLRTSSIIEMNAASAGDGQQVMASRTDASMETGPGVSSRQALTCLFMIFNGRLFSQG